MKNSTTLIAVLFFMLFISPVMVKGQQDSSHVQFHGSNTFNGQYSNMQGVGSEIPPSFFRNDLKMTLMVYDVPISATFFITSLQNDYRQSINNFRNYLNVFARK